MKIKPDKKNSSPADISTWGFLQDSGVLNEILEALDKPIRKAAAELANEALEIAANEQTRAYMFSVLAEESGNPLTIVIAIGLGGEDDQDKEYKFTLRELLTDMLHTRDPIRREDVVAELRSLANMVLGS